MLTSMSSLAMTQPRPFFVLPTTDANSATSRTSTPTGFKRHAGYGTGSDLAPGGAL